MLDAAAPLFIYECSSLQTVCATTSGTSPTYYKPLTTRSVHKQFLNEAMFPQSVLCSSGCASKASALGLRLISPQHHWHTLLLVHTGLRRTAPLATLTHAVSLSGLLLIQAQLKNTSCCFNSAVWRPPVRHTLKT